jgi:DNA-binding transcriptional LysR family regulator
MALDSLADLRVFRQIVASGGITAAAHALGDNKNRISQRLAALERAVGQKLADRTTRTWRLTEAGERLLARSEAVLVAADEAERATRREQELEGVVRVAVRSSLVGIGIGERFAALLERHSTLELQVEVIDDAADESTLAARGIDLAVTAGRQRDSSLVARRMPELTFVMCASPAYLARRGRPAHPRDLTNHECIRRLGTPRETHWPLMGPRGRPLKARLGGRLACSDARFQTEVLYAGFGIGLRPHREVRRATELGQLERVLPGWAFPSIAVWLVGMRGRFTLPRVARVADAIEEAIATLV